MSGLNTKLRLAILDDYQGAAMLMADWSPLQGRVEVVPIAEHLATENSLVATLQDFDIVFTMRERSHLTREVLYRLPRLKLIVTAGAVNAAIDVTAAREQGIVVTGTGYSSHSTAELTWALILAAFRHLPAEINSLRSGGWQVGVGGELFGRTLGVLGLGGVGSHVAQIGAAFGMRVLTWSQNLSADRAKANHATLVDRDVLFRESDVVTIHLRLSDRTTGLIGRDELKLMKKSAYLVNTSRGPIVNESSLLDALDRGLIAGAALDVFDKEPLPLDHPYRSLYVSKELYRMFFGQAVEDITAWLDGEPIRIVPDVRELGANSTPPWVDQDGLSSVSTNGTDLRL